LLSTVLELGHYLTLQVMKKLKIDVVDEMEGLMSDS
jgi:pyridoxal biosynthesis lyase PdxS